MNETLFELLADWGVPLLTLTTLASCLALPVPSSLMMLAAGAFVATGDLALASVASGAMGGAILGDQIGYAVGRRGGDWLEARLAHRPRRRKLFDRARETTRRHGGPGVFLTRWLFSPLGPYANLAAGATGMRWVRFTAWAAAGEAVWVGLYVGLGYTFTDNLEMAASLAGQTLGFLAALALTVLLGARLLRAARRDPGRSRSASGNRR